MLGGVRPSGNRRSWWLREALAAESGDLSGATRPLRGSITADVVVLGGGYTGLWTAWHLSEQAPGARIVVLEADICGGGPSGRNGGFVTGWWDELPTLIDRHGDEGALAIARAIDAAVDDVGTWCAAHDVDAWYTKAGSLSISAAPAQDGLGAAAVAACEALGVADEFVVLSPRGCSRQGGFTRVSRWRLHAGRGHCPARRSCPRSATGPARARGHDP